MLNNEETPAVGTVRGFEDLIRAGSADDLEYSHYAQKSNAEEPVITGRVVSS